MDAQFQQEVDIDEIMLRLTNNQKTRMLDLKETQDKRPI